MSGLKLRLSRIFRGDGRSLVIAMDHGTGLDTYPPLHDPAAMFEAVVQGGADAVLLSPGLLREYGAHLGSMGIIMRVDGGTTAMSEGTSAKNLLYSVEDALRLGADAVACMGFPGSPWEAQTLANLATLVGQCQRWGVPVMAEMIPGGFADSSSHSPDRVRFAVRVGCEMGADFIKTKFVEPVGEFERVTTHSFKPVLILGGGEPRDDTSLLQDVRRALGAGAAGVAMGRCVWGHPSPRRLVRLLSEAIHHDDAETAIAMTPLSGLGHPPAACPNHAGPLSTQPQRGRR